MVKESEMELSKEDINELVELIRRGMIVADLESGRFRIPLDGGLLFIDKPN